MTCKPIDPIGMNLSVFIHIAVDQISARLLISSHTGPRSEMIQLQTSHDPSRGRICRIATPDNNASQPERTFVQSRVSLPVIRWIPLWKIDYLTETIRVMRVQERHRRVVYRRALDRAIAYKSSMVSLSHFEVNLLIQNINCRDYKPHSLKSVPSTNMAVTIAEYSVDNFNRQRDFRDALSGFDRHDGGFLASTTMKDLFRNHKVESILGLQLLHKHDKLNAGERMTDVRGTSNPLTFELGAKASIWGFDSATQQLVPLEYSLGAESVEWEASEMQDFLKDFREAVVKEGVQDIFGLSLYPGDGYPGRVEFSAGRANVNLTPVEVCHQFPTPSQ
jgi:hypothetical protein